MTQTTALLRLWVLGTCGSWFVKGYLDIPKQKYVKGSQGFIRQPSMHVIEANFQPIHRLQNSCYETRKPPLSLIQPLATRQPSRLSYEKGFYANLGTWTVQDPIYATSSEARSILNIGWLFGPYLVITTSSRRPPPGFHAIASRPVEGLPVRLL